MTKNRDPLFNTLPRYAEAGEFRDTFSPDKDADYGWVVDLAVAQYTVLRADFEKIDDKAAAIITYLGSGTGVLTLGAIAMSNSANVWVILGLLPAFCFAAVALRHAFAARSTRTVPYPPSIQAATHYVDYFKDKSKATFLGQWHLVNELFHDIINQKADDVDRASRWCVVTVASLAAPLFVSLLVRLFA
jgi:hypothetical protein